MVAQATLRSRYDVRGCRTGNGRLHPFGLVLGAVLSKRGTRETGIETTNNGSNDERGLTKMYYYTPQKMPRGTQDVTNERTN